MSGIEKNINFKILPLDDSLREKDLFVICLPPDTNTRPKLQIVSSNTLTESKFSYMDFCGWTPNAVHFQTSVVQMLTASAEHLTDATEFLIPLQAQEWPVHSFYVLEFSRCALKPLNKGNITVKSGFVVLHLPQTLILVNIMQVQTSLSDTRIHKMYKANECPRSVVSSINNLDYWPF